MKPLHILLAIAVAAAWGVNFVVIKVGLDSFPPILLSALRFGLAGLPVIFIWKTRPAPWRWVFSIALCLGVFKFSLLFIGMNLGAGAGLSSLVLQMQAFFTVLIAFFLLGERPTRRQMMGLLLAFTGLGIILSNLSSAGRNEGALIGISFVILAAIFWALSNICMKKAQSTNPLHLMIWVSALSSPVLFAVSWFWEGSDSVTYALTHITINAGLTVLYLAVIATLAGFGAWAYLMKTYDTGTVAPFSLLVPIFGMSSSAILLGETITQTSMLAALFIFAGLYLSTIRQGFFKRKRQLC
jgi:O-acetylserine/cysteine efflux transporter